MTASGSYGTKVDAVVTIGVVSGTFSATTMAINPGDLAEALETLPSIVTAKDQPLAITATGTAGAGSAPCGAAKGRRDRGARAPTVRAA